MVPLRTKQDGGGGEREALRVPDNQKIIVDDKKMNPGHSFCCPAEGRHLRTTTNVYDNQLLNLIRPLTTRVLVELACTPKPGYNIPKLV